MCQGSIGEYTENFFIKKSRILECLLLKETTEVLCAGPDDVKFNETFYRAYKDIEEEKKKEQGKSKLVELFTYTKRSDCLCY